MNPNDPLPDHVYLATVAHLTAQGERDLARGGVASAHVAAALDCGQSSASDRLMSLAERGYLVQVDGFPAGAGQPRPSYLPPGHEDAPTAEESTGGRVQKNVRADD